MGGGEDKGKEPTKRVLGSNWTTVWLLIHLGKEAAGSKENQLEVLEARSQKNQVVGKSKGGGGGPRIGANQEERESGRKNSENQEDGQIQREGTGVGWRGGKAWKRRWDLGAERTGPIGAKEAGPETGADESGEKLTSLRTTNQGRSGKGRARTEGTAN